MATCKDCLSESVCRFNDGHNLYCKKGYECPHFKNKANALEIPDKDIIYTKGKWLVLNIESNDLGKAIKAVINYLTNGGAGKDAEREDQE